MASDKTKKLDDAHFKAIAERAASQNFDDEKTQIVGSKTIKEDVTTQNEGRTRIYRQSSTPNTSQDQSQPVASADHNPFMDDPPTGWLVATDGPGRGAVLTLGIGMNSVGRGGNVRVPISFNDEEISRGNCFSIAYDSKNKNYFLLPGDGKSLVYIEDQPLLERATLKSGIHFSIGQSTFKFIALCDKNFDW